MKILENILKESICHRQYEIVRREAFWNMLVAKEDEMATEVPQNRRWQQDEDRNAVGKDVPSSNMDQKEIDHFIENPMHAKTKTFG